MRVSKRLETTSRSKTCPGVPGALTDPFDPTIGFSDVVYVGLASPKKPIKVASTGAAVIWGVGATAMFPTASDEVLGAGKYGVGPSAVAAYLGPKWTLGVFPQHWWSVAGDEARVDVNLTNIQYFVFWAPPWDPEAQWRIGMSPNVSVNWEAEGDRLTRPVGIGIGRMISIGQLPVHVHFEADYSVVHPDDKLGTRWDFRVYFDAIGPSNYINPGHLRGTLHFFCRAAVLSGADLIITLTPWCILGAGTGTAVYGASKSITLTTTYTWFYAGSITANYPNLLFEHQKQFLWGIKWTWPSSAAHTGKSDFGMMVPGGYMRVLKSSSSAWDAIGITDEEAMGEVLNGSTGIYLSEDIFPVRGNFLQPKPNQYTITWFVNSDHNDPQVVTHTCNFNTPGMYITPRYIIL